MHPVNPISIRRAVKYTLHVSGGTIIFMFRFRKLEDKP